MGTDSKFRPGWYARLQGEQADLDDWTHCLNEPFDPVALNLPDGETVLWSSEFEGLEDAGEVRERAIGLIGRLNGALSLWTDARPVRFGGVYKIDEAGNRHAWVFAELVAELGRFVMRATAVLIGPDGKPVPPPPPAPSVPQGWTTLASANDDVADLLDHFGRSDNWYDIYKTFEFAQHIVGSEHKLSRLLGDRWKDAKNVRTSANFYRHAKAHRPSKLATLGEAKPILAEVVRAVLAAVLK